MSVWIFDDARISTGWYLMMYALVLDDAWMSDGVSVLCQVRCMGAGWCISIEVPQSNGRRAILCSPHAQGPELHQPVRLSFSPLLSIVVHTQFSHINSQGTLRHITIHFHHITFHLHHIAIHFHRIASFHVPSALRSITFDPPLQYGKRASNDVPFTP